MTSMIELPEAVTLANQLTKTLKGKVVVSAIRGQSPHKFAFTEGLSNEEFSNIVEGKKLGASTSIGNVILISIEPNYLLSLGCGGEKILYHKDAKLPKKQQLLMKFHDESYLTVSISGWGELRLLQEDNLDNHPHIYKEKIDPTDPLFTFDRFQDMIDHIPQSKSVSMKYFYVTDPGFSGIGNGVIQDIFYLSKAHPKQNIKHLSSSSRKKLFDMTKYLINEMIQLHGRDTETDIFGNHGRYKTILGQRSVGQPCGECSAIIMKEQYLGGSIYFCPNCQVVS